MDLLSRARRETDATFVVAVAGDKIPDHLRPALVRWIAFGQRPGGFLCAVLSNDLAEAVIRADDASVAALKGIVIWLHNDTPSGCHGSAAAFAAWAEQGGLAGK